MTVWTDTVAAFLTSALAGGMLFFAFVFAPLVFRTLPAEAAGRLIRQVFPVYYRVSGATALAAGVLALPGAAPWAGAVLLVIAALFAVARQGLMPRINALRDRELQGDAKAGARFARLHRLSVAINMVQLLLAVVLALILIAA
ncbi:MAG: DUF4149 domain-containing protein [Rhodovibrionaceae bacterium]|nr:DUF4149 domain-containing protein [Rhodovibrionaceae bacterium]